MGGFDAKKIPGDIGYYLTGFADGEGSFNISFRRRKDYAMPWKISLCFNISQRDQTVLRLFRRQLGCGTLRQRSDGIWYFEVNSFTAITDHVIPFFDRFGFLSEKKRRDFQKFTELAELIRLKKHLNRDGIRAILAIRSTMNDGGVGRRKYSDRQILSYFPSGKSSETIRQASVRYTPKPSVSQEMI